MTASKLPIGLQTFSGIIEQVGAYVDETAYVWAMVSQGRYYFPSRLPHLRSDLITDQPLNDQHDQP